MHSALKLAFFAGLTFLIAAEVAYGQAQHPNYAASDPGIQQRMKSDGRFAPRVPEASQHAGPIETGHR